MKKKTKKGVAGATGKSSGLKKPVNDDPCYKSHSKRSSSSSAQK